MQPDDVRARFGEHADHDEPTSPPRITSATAIRFTDTSMWCARSSMPGFEIFTQHLAVAQLVEDVVQLARDLERDLRYVTGLVGRAESEPPRREALGDQLPRVGARPRTR